MITFAGVKAQIKIIFSDSYNQWFEFIEDLAIVKPRNKVMIYYLAVLPVCDR